MKLRIDAKIAHQNCALKLRTELRIRSLKIANKSANFAVGHEVECSIKAAFCLVLFNDDLLSIVMVHC